MLPAHRGFGAGVPWQSGSWSYWPPARSSASQCFKETHTDSALRDRITHRKTRWWTDSEWRGSSGPARASTRNLTLNVRKFIERLDFFSVTWLHRVACSSNDPKDCSSAVSCTLSKKENHMKFNLSVLAVFYAETGVQISCTIVTKNWHKYMCWTL